MRAIHVEDEIGCADRENTVLSGVEKKSDALVALGKFLQSRAYRFTTVTPATHARVVAHKSSYPATNLTDIFGWSCEFRSDHFSDVAEMLEQAGELDTSGDLVRSKVRFSTLGEQLYVHSAYPTDAPDAVFFGPDTYRFARVIKQFMPTEKVPPELSILDAGLARAAFMPPLLFRETLQRCCSSTSMKRRCVTAR